MTNLTEQWKKGELPSGWYYIKDENGVIYPAENCLNYDHLNDRAETAFYYAETEITEILAPVPSYGKWKAADNCMFENEVLRLKNATLKDLLKQAETQIIAYKNNDTLPERAFYEKEVEELLTKIDEVLK